MVCAESLSCGTPVVGFCAGGTESISMKQHSKFVEYGNIEKLGEAIMEFENYKKNNQIIIAEDARKRYDMKLMADKYYNLYCSML